MSPASPGTIPAIVLGGSGYVAGELLRLLAGHPHFTLAGILSDSRPGEAIAASFGHLAAAYPDTRFSSQQDIEAIVARERGIAIFGAAPHGATAALIDGLLAKSESAFGAGAARVVDISADFRYRSAAAYESVYQHPHGAPGRLATFTCALPEHLAHSPTPHVAHPGCFATATLLASVPLLKLGLIEPELFVAAITGSTGSGRKAVDGTHHPLRHSDLYTYNALGHRHTPEIVACALAASGVEARYAFVPHSGPFARGIYATMFTRLKAGASAADARDALEAYYANAPFVRVTAEPPRLKDIV
ncbi:MAG: hypothetical protein ACRETK_05170, partial [Steroidobacteraceae bacterium]